MYNHRGIRKNANGKEYPSDFYNCSTYCLTIERETKQCFSHSVSTRALTELVLETIRTTAGYALANRKAFIQKVRSISQVRQQEAAKELSRRVAKAKKRMAELDILYMTRVQKERFFNEEDYIRLKNSYVLTREKMAQAKPTMAVLHPLPRVNEIALDVDDDPRAAYFEQVQNGVYVRMALIMTLLGLADPKAPKEEN